jgi:ribosomal protein S27E
MTSLYAMTHCREGLCQRCGNTTAVAKPFGAYKVTCATCRAVLRRPQGEP